jgi:hypothetical protein
MSMRVSNAVSRTQFTQVSRLYRARLVGRLDPEKQIIERGDNVASVCGQPVYHCT